jgi:hypothetical protein
MALIPEEILEDYKPADSRGRVTLGSEYAGKKIKLAILEVKDRE